MYRLDRVSTTSGTLCHLKGHPKKRKNCRPEYDVPLVDHPSYPTPTKILSRSKENIGATESPIRDEDVVPQVMPLPRVDNTIEEKGIGDREPEGLMKGGETNRERDTNRLNKI